MILCISFFTQFLFTINLYMTSNIFEEKCLSLFDLEHHFWCSRCRPKLVPFSYCYAQMWHSLMWALSKVFTRILFCLLLPSYYHLVCHKLGGLGFKLAFTMVYNSRTLSFHVPSLFCIMVERLRERIACCKICHFRCTKQIGIFFPCSRKVKRAQWTVSINSTMHIFILLFYSIKSFIFMENRKVCVPYRLSYPFISWIRNFLRIF